MLRSLVCVTILGRVVAEDLIVNRHFKGDMFSKQDCDADFCRSRGISISSQPLLSQECSCQCDPQWPTFREDRNTCVDSLHECELADFVTGSSTEKIPFVFLPLSGQLVYPSASILIPSGSLDPKLVSPICVVSTVDIMTNMGWEDITNFTQEFQQPFQLYSDNGKTYLQWMGNEVIHQALEGRLLLIHLLCKHTGQQSRRLFAPCVSFRIAGSPGSVQSKAPASSETLTERDYLAIGICAGFLVMLYIFAMIVFIVIKKKQRRDKRLREQFLQLPIPQGIGFKSSKILGLDEKYLTDLARLSNDNRCSKRHKNCHNCELHNDLSQGHFGFAKKFKANRKTPKQIVQSDSDSDGNPIVFVNEKLLEAHKKVVENKLQLEVARTVCYSHNDETDESSGESTMEIMSKLNLSRNGKNSSKRFFPHLEEIPEESRSSTFKDLKKQKTNSDSGDASDGSISTSDLEFKDDGYTNYSGKSQDSTAKSNPQSMDSGIVTRSTSPTPDHGSDNDASSSQGIYSDNETVDVADSDETDSDNDVADVSKSGDKNQHTAENISDILSMSNNNLDFLSEIYNTAFSKVPKVYASDTESIYSYNSAIDNTMDYSSLDIETNNMLDIYRNPHLMRRRMKKSLDSSIYEDINTNPTKSSDQDGITEVYISHDNDKAEKEVKRIEIVTDDFTYASGEKMMISIAQNDENVFSDKLTIEINNSEIQNRIDESDKSTAFDPDTLERNLDKRNDPQHENAKGTENSKKEAKDESTNGNLRYSFRLFDADNTHGRDRNSVASVKRENDLKTRISDSEKAVPIPARRNFTPKLPPKPIIARK